MSSKGKVRGGKPADLALIETMRWEPDIGFLRLDQHMRRLARSADALGFRPAPPDLLQRLEAAVEGASPLRIRLEMSFRGHVEIASTAFTPIPEDTVWRIGIAKTRIPSDDPMYRHKTSRREVYEAARAEFSPEEADEVILLNERDEICEGTITNVFVEQADGILTTPPISSGLLAGVLRGDLIRERRARSGLLTKDDLLGKTLFVGNSLRGLIRAKLVEAPQAEITAPSNISGGAAALQKQLG
jgi:4-amino-4-deoxychorismate lyase